MGNKPFFTAAFILLVLWFAGPISVLAEEEPPSILGDHAAVGAPAPTFTLKDLQGREQSLEKLRENQPVVLVTGSYSCPIYRDRLAALNQLYERYSDRVAFFILYTVEAHPQGSDSPYADREWLTPQNRKEGILVEQPADYATRADLASRAQAKLGSQVPVLVDTMDNATWAAYGSAPNAAFLIDSQGLLQTRQDWFKPATLERKIVELLQEEPARW